MEPIVIQDAKIRLQKVTILVEDMKAVVVTELVVPHVLQVALEDVWTEENVIQALLVVQSVVQIVTQIVMVLLGFNALAAEADVKKPVAVDVVLDVKVPVKVHILVLEVVVLAVLLAQNYVKADVQIIVQKLVQIIVPKIVLNPVLALPILLNKKRKNNFK